MSFPLPINSTYYITLHSSYLEWPKYKTAKPLQYKAYRTRNGKQLVRKWLGEKESFATLLRSNFVKLGRRELNKIVHQMVPPLTKVADINCSLLLIYRPRRDERLSSVDHVWVMSSRERSTWAEEVDRLFVLSIGLINAVPCVGNFIFSVTYFKY